VIQIWKLKEIIQLDDEVLELDIIVTILVHAGKVVIGRVACGENEKMSEM
jgi:hypothetical protein